MITRAAGPFRAVEPLDFVAIYHEVLPFWDTADIFAHLRERNRGGAGFSFIDGPITANNPMGVHHAWGRTYKDVVQRYRAMRGFDQRYQNGFDCQGLWVEVEVEKALGFNSKREIETFGIEQFSRACRERVLKYSAVQTEQSRKLGQWMDWRNSYYTMSDENITYIWHFLAECEKKDWLYLGRRSMPWCPRCGTSVSQHEMLDSHAELTHQSVVVALPLEDFPDTYLLAWTTTPWTLPANVALAVHPDLEYEKVLSEGRTYIVEAARRRHFPKLTDVRERVKGVQLVGLWYRGPFDDLPAQHGIVHRVVTWKDVAADEGTGIVHIAPGCGQEDFELGLRHDLAVVAPTSENGTYVDGFGELVGRSVTEVASTITAMLRAKRLLYSEAPYRHRYPTCWRCSHELIFRVVTEWFIRADELRPRAIEANAAVHWQPEYMGLRMQDWLRNMADWCISRKRYWGLPLPFYPCPACNRLTVVGSREMLRQLAVEPERVDALPELHRPWIDEVVIRCPGCGAHAHRVTEVGDCWLDAGIVPFSTLKYLEDRSYWERWFPADFIVEMMAQLRGWFYSMLMMSVTLVGRAPYERVVAHERVLGGDGREMHKSWGNAIWFDDAVEKMGPDVIRYLFASQSVSEPVRFGYEAAREVKRKFLTLWNVYALFVTYATIDAPGVGSGLVPPARVAGLEAWLLSRLQDTVREVRAALDEYQFRRAITALEDFIQDDLSNWYVRRRRRQFWKGEMDDAKQQAYEALHHVLVRVCQLSAPVVPFVAEHMYRNLTADRDGAPQSVFLTPYPEVYAALENRELDAGVALVRRVLSVGLAARNAGKLKVRKPLATAVVAGPPSTRRWLDEYRADILDELNVEALEFVDDLDDRVDYSVTFAPKDMRAYANVDREALAAALAARPARDVRVEILTTGTVALATSGDEPSTIPGGDVAVTATGRAPYAAAAERDIVVVLDTRITPDLWRKGVARHVVHEVQNLRKRAGLRVDNRIRLAIAAPSDIAAALQEHDDYVRRETLAVAVVMGAAPAGAASLETAIEGANVQIALTPEGSRDT